MGYAAAKSQHICGALHLVERRGSAGWARTERALRGERLLTSTNDFTPPLNPESGGLAAMFGSVDEFDYVDRLVELGSVTRVLAVAISCTMQDAPPTFLVLDSYA